MKKFFALLLVAALAAGLGSTAAVAQENAGLKLGFSIVTSLNSSRDAGDSDGLAQVESDAVAVLVDANGVIVNVAIDSVQAKMPFTAQGKLGANFPAQPKTKTELGTEYGMSAVSAVGEWDQQIAALRQYLIGKTAEQVQGIALDDSTRPTGADLTAGCTMAIGSYINGVLKAIELAQPCGASAADRLGVGIVTDTSLSVDSMDGASGLCEAYSNYAATTVNADGAVTACVIDSTQGVVKFDETGKITTDLSAAVTTKQEIGDAYGMKAASAIGLEWYEQANAFSAYVLGKTAAQIEGIAVDAETVPTGADLVASVTIPVGEFQDAVIKAVSVAK